MLGQTSRLLRYRKRERLYRRRSSFHRVLWFGKAVYHLHIRCVLYAYRIRTNEPDRELIDSSISATLSYVHALNENRLKTTISSNKKRIVLVSHRRIGQRRLRCYCGKI